MDYTSKWAGIGLVSSVKSSNFINFFNKVWAGEACPEEIITDDGCHFVNEAFQCYLKHCGISHHCCGDFQLYPEVVASGISIRDLYMEGYISNCLASHWAIPHCSTGCSSSELLHGRQMHLRLPVITTHTHSGYQCHQACSQATTVKQEALWQQVRCSSTRIHFKRWRSCT